MSCTRTLARGLGRVAARLSRPVAVAYRDDCRAYPEITITPEDYCAAYHDEVRSLEDPSASLSMAELARIARRL